MLNNFKDRLINIRLRKDERLTITGFLIIGLLIVLLVANIIYLNFVFLKNNNILINASRSNAPSSTIPTVISPIISETITPTTSTIQVNNQGSGGNQALIKDYYIPLGSGSSQAGDWEDVAGALVVVDFSQYQNIKEIRLEASVSVPTGNQIVWIRLFNKTDQHPVWYSDVSTVSNATSYLISSPVVYDFGQKTYQVQIKTQLKSLANLAYARIHVVLK